MESYETIRVVGLLIALVVAVICHRDAVSRGMNGLAWGLGIFLLMIVFLPLYLILRKPKLDAPASDDNTKT